MIDATLWRLLASNFLASVGIGVAMIAIPWALASRDGGAASFGILMTVSNLGFALATPWIGVAIDRANRKTFMLLLRLAFLIGLGAVLWLSIGPQKDLAAYLLYYLLGAGFYVINIPLRTAFVQELYFGGDYARVNGILEVENQVAAVTIGALAVLLIERYGLSPLIFMNAACLAAAILLISGIRYERRNTRSNMASTRSDALADMREGLAIMRERPRLSLVLMIATLPYVIVILYSYLHPVALAALQGAKGSDYAIVEVLFALGSIAAGWALIALPIAVGRLPKAIGIVVGLFALATLMQALMPFKTAFFVIGAAFGFLNAMARVFRQTLLMNALPPHQIGRVGSFIQTWIMLLRTVTIAVATGLIAGIGVGAALWFAALIPALGWLTLKASQRSHNNNCSSNPQEVLS